MQRAIIVDDEELSVKRLSKLLAEYEEIEVSRTFFNPWEAYEYAKEHPIDIAFLDVSMPEVDGMKLSSLLMELSDGIQVVFVTGFDEYAVDAFERSALDYLLKPVMAKRLSKTMERIFKRRPREEASMPVQHPIMDVRLFNGLRIGRRGLERESIRLRSPKTEEFFRIWFASVTRAGVGLRVIFCIRPRRKK